MEILPDSDTGQIKWSHQQVQWVSKSPQEQKLCPVWEATLPSVSSPAHPLLIPWLTTGDPISNHPVPALGSLDPHWCEVVWLRTSRVYSQAPNAVINDTQHWHSTSETPVAHPTLAGKWNCWPKSPSQPQLPRFYELSVTPRADTAIKPQPCRKAGRAALRF